VLGQAHTPRRRWFPLAAIVLVAGIAPAMGGADSTLPGSRPTTSALRARSSEIANRSRAAVLELYSLDQRLGAARHRLQNLREQAATLRAERASLERRRLIATRSTRIAQAQLAERLQLLYEQGDVEPLEIVFGAGSLDEALSSLDNLSRVSSQAESVLRELRSARTQLRSAAAALATREAALARASNEARATSKALGEARASRSSYIGSLAAERRLNEAQIAHLVARAHTAHLRSTQISRSASAAASLTAYSPAARPAVSTQPRSPAAGTNGSAITVTATGYSLGGATATGIPTGWGVAAVDPSVIPLGTHLTIPGYGEAVAADTGGSIVGATIDLWFPSEAQAGAWGRRTVTVVLH
jgi:peptidoglycan DL-endopeptidase CwlO